MGDKVEMHHVHRHVCRSNQME